MYVLSESKVESLKCFIKIQDRPNCFYMELSRSYVKNKLKKDNINVKVNQYEFSAISQVIDTKDLKYKNGSRDWLLKENKDIPQAK